MSHHDELEDKTKEECLYSLDFEDSTKLIELEEASKKEEENSFTKLEINLEPASLLQANAKPTTAQPETDEASNERESSISHNNSQYQGYTTSQNGEEFNVDDYQNLHNIEHFNPFQTFSDKDIATAQQHTKKSTSDACSLAENNNNPSTKEQKPKPTPKPKPNSQEKSESSSSSSKASSKNSYKNLQKASKPKSSTEASNTLKSTLHTTQPTSKYASKYHSTGKNSISENTLAKDEAGEAEVDELTHLTHLNQLNQLNQLNELTELNDLSELSELNTPSLNHTFMNTHDRNQLSQYTQLSDVHHAVSSNDTAEKPKRKYFIPTLQSNKPIFEFDILKYPNRSNSNYNPPNKNNNNTNLPKGKFHSRKPTSEKIRDENLDPLFVRPSQNTLPSETLAGKGFIRKVKNKKANTNREINFRDRQSEPKRRIKREKEKESPGLYRFKTPGIRNALPPQIQTPIFTSHPETTKNTIQNIKQSDSGQKDKLFVKDLQNIAVLLSQANKYRKEYLQYKQNSDGHNLLLKKLQLFADENKRLRIDNFRLKRELSVYNGVGENYGNFMSETSSNHLLESEKRILELEKENHYMRQQVARVSETCKNVMNLHSYKLQSLNDKISLDEHKSS